jgi:subtilisin family serine protease
VVALLDTGVGSHAWLDDVVRRYGSIAALRDGAREAEDFVGVLTGHPVLEGTESSDAAHGTFMAGLVHQLCPDADLLSVRVTQGGAIAESDLVEALALLLFRQQDALNRGDPGRLVDVVTLASGFYHETPVDPWTETSLLGQVIAALGRLGVCVVASAGNDATARPMYPASLAGEQCDNDSIPLVSVGALNPDGRSVALFSNAGPWVTTHRPGVAVVSTMPGFEGGLEPMARSESYGLVRSSVDPDDFRSGFATWSGTSFSAAVVAGEIAERLSRFGLESGPPMALSEVVERGRRALAEITRP